MAIVITTWDLPTTQAQLEVNAARSQDWTRRVLSFPGTVEWRALRNPLSTTPQVMVLQEYDSLDSARNGATSSEVTAIIAEMRSVGCSNFSIQVWDRSPLVPEPLRP